jgi:ketosteroid isomerase-like protein
MRLVLALLLMLNVTAGTPARADTGDEAAIQDVIGRQLEAFRRDDAAAAFALASPDIQAMFGAPGYFMGMVIHGYPPVYRPQQVAFGALVSENGVPVQKVELIGPDGAAWTALYAMEKQDDGTWKIAGCRLVESHAVGS